MKSESLKFRKKSREAMADETLQQALGLFQTGFPMLRKMALQSLPDYEEICDRAAAIKDHSLEHLDELTIAFKDKVESRGGSVHFCYTAKEARQKMVALCREAKAKKIIKSKSMVSEEIALNPALEAAGMKVLETDLGEYIIQLAGEPPSHIVGPALHKSKEQVAALFEAHHKTRHNREKGEALVAEARGVLRKQYFQADVCITGANFLIAETGTVVIVTNEGNADLCRVLPKTHIVITSMEKVIPSLNDLSVFLRLLGRSASGQELTAYTTLVSGPRAEDEVEGPEDFHVVIVDGGRSKLLGTPQQEMLRCIKCGACMNHCPVYGTVGGHAYGWVYPGPIGAALNPVLEGLAEMKHLYNATTFCGACDEVCPVKIPLTKIFRHWRTQALKRQIPGTGETLALKTWAMLAVRPRLYGFSMAIVLPLLKAMAGRKKYLKRLPFAAGWMNRRVLPAPEGKRFVGSGKGK